MFSVLGTFYNKLLKITSSTLLDVLQDTAILKMYWKTLHLPLTE